LAPYLVILSFYSAVDDGPREVPELEVRERSQSTLRNLDDDPREVPKLEVRKLVTSMAGPLRVLAASPAAATTEVEDVDGGAPGGCWRQGPAAATTEVEDVDGGPPRGCWW
jgi:hypothetical protein